MRDRQEVKANHSENKGKETSVDFRSNERWKVKMELYIYIYIYIQYCAKVLGHKYFHQQKMVLSQLFLSFAVVCQ